VTYPTASALSCSGSEYPPYIWTTLPTAIDIDFQESPNGVASSVGWSVENTKVTLQLISQTSSRSRADERDLSAITKGHRVQRKTPGKRNDSVSTLVGG